ncbi:ferrochelatase [Propionibacteriaceae bacterium Y2011]|uniref:ferrochelatase n=1 Tax=Microlunatus sp. Y2014 TaxID=3418488 RepID=UPI003B4EBFEE
MLDPYDGVLLVSFGGPEAPDEVMPFLRRVTAGRNIPDERLALVAEHYHDHGGRSPINDQCRALLAALEQELARREVDVELWWGNRNSEPYLANTIAAAQQSGARRLLALTTSAYPSYSSCRQYRENVADALAEAGADDLVVDRIGQYATDEGFVTANADAVDGALRRLGDTPPARILFVTHSIPTAMAESAGPSGRPDAGSYVAWHESVGERVVARLSEQWPGLRHELVYCSRSGPPSQPWLEPDVNDRLRELAGDPHPVVLAPIGFTSDHMEVIQDLDTEAAATAAEVGITCVRAATAGTHPAFVSGLVDALQARAEVARGERQPSTEPGTLGGPGWLTCRPDCCPNLREPGRSAIAELLGEPATGGA